MSESMTAARMREDRLNNAPIGTKAPAIIGGFWYRTELGWKWLGPDGSGGIFHRPGGDWTGTLIYPKEAPND